MKLEAGFKRRCEAIAVDWRHHLRLRVYDPLPADVVIHELEGEVVSPEELPALLSSVSPEAVQNLMTHDDWSAGIVRLSPLLMVNHPSHSSARRQANLMHEISHLLLEHPMIGFDPTTGLPLRDPRCEEEATYLGSCLQIPRLGLRWTIHQGFDVAAIALHFGASESIVRFRSNMLGLRTTL